MDKRMHRFRSILLYMLISIVTLSTQAQPMESFDLNDYQWKNRVLLIFSPEQSEFTLSSQHKIYDKNRAGFEDRDLIIFHISELEVPTKFGSQIPAKQHAALKEQFGIPDGEFTILLIGKDGGEKLRTNDVLSKDQLFGIIDAMPMRQREMKDDTGD